MTAVQVKKDVIQSSGTNFCIAPIILWQLKRGGGGQKGDQGVWRRVRVISVWSSTVWHHKSRRTEKLNETEQKIRFYCHFNPPAPQKVQQPCAERYSIYRINVLRYPYQTVKCCSSLFFLRSPFLSFLLTVLSSSNKYCNESPFFSTLTQTSGAFWIFDNKSNVSLKFNPHASESATGKRGGVYHRNSSQALDLLWLMTAVIYFCIFF